MDECPAVCDEHGNQVYGTSQGRETRRRDIERVEDTKPTFHEKNHIAQVRELGLDDESREIDGLVETENTFDNMDTVPKMKEIVPSIRVMIPVYEVMDKEKGLE